MTTVKELRIGNLMQDRHTGNWLEVYEIIRAKDKHVVCFHDPNRAGKAPREFEPEPIPLTVEILAKCGFNHVHPFIYGNDEYNFELYLLGSNFTPKIESEYLNIYILNLHQLQNFFFCLMGRELTFTP